MRVIGVTGGVGAGKSTVLSYLAEAYGARVIEADAVGHEVMEPGTPAYDRIRETFGSGILGADGRIDRKILGSAVFADPEKLLRLNAIVHPAVKEEILRRIALYREQQVSLVVVEAALFLEENYDAFCDETWYIYTDENKRRERLMESRGYTEERITQILRSQRSHGEFLERCQYMIDNNGTAGETHRQIDGRMRE